MTKISDKIAELFKIFVENFMKLNKHFKIEELFERKDDFKQTNVYECYLEIVNLIKCEFF